MKNKKISGISKVSGVENMQNFVASSIFWSVWRGNGRKGSKNRFFASGFLIKRKLYYIILLFLCGIIAAKTFV